MGSSSVTTHQYQTLVASSEIGSNKGNQRALVHIWDHVNLRTITEIRKEQFGSYINRLVFSPKSDDNLLLLVSRDKPHIVLFVDWERNELIYSITVRHAMIVGVKEEEMICFSVNLIRFSRFYSYLKAQNGLLVLVKDIYFSIILIAVYDH